LFITTCIAKHCTRPLTQSYSCFQFILSDRDNITRNDSIGVQETDASKLVLDGKPKFIKFAFGKKVYTVEWKLLNCRLDNDYKL